MAVLLAGMLLMSTATTDMIELAAQAGVDPEDLAGAVNTTGLEPLEYLYMAGHLQRPAPPQKSALERRLDCIAWFESRDTPGARNPRSGAAGLFQFLPSTWRTTPQGKAGLSVYDPVAARDAARWMIGQGRIREWEVVTRGLC